MTRRQRKQSPPDDYMTVEEAAEHMNAWAAAQNEIVEARERMLADPRQRERLFKHAAAGHRQLAASERGAADQRSKAQLRAAAMLEMADRLIRDHPGDYVGADGTIINGKRLRIRIAEEHGVGERTVRNWLDLDGTLPRLKTPGRFPPSGVRVSSRERGAY